MKVALVVPIELPPLPSDDDLDTAARRLGRLADLGVPVSLAVPGRLWRHLADRDLPVPAGDVQWLRMGWNEPDLTVLPEAARSLQLTREADALNAVGIDPTGFFTSTWDPTLVPTLTGHGIDHAVVAAGTTGAYGAADRFDRVLPVFLAGPEPGSEGTRTLVTVVTDQPEAVLGRLGDVSFTTPARHLADDPPAHRLRPPVDSPAFRPDPADPSSEILYRKMLRLVAALGERSPAGVVSDVLEVQHHATYPGPIDPLLRRELHRTLLRARHLLDGRRRGEGWVEVARLDWDADGADEVQIESVAVSLVVDPDTGRILYIDDKVGEWPVTAIPDDGDPGLILARVIAGDGLPQSAGLPTVEKVEERRGGAVVTVGGTFQSGSLSVTVAAEGSILRLAYHLEDMPESRLGPEIPFSLGPTAVRVDGGDWIQIDGPVAATGHRFRFSDGERQVLVVMPVPGDCFARPLDPFGVVVWAHWPTGGDGDYELSVDLAP